MSFTTDLVHKFLAPHNTPRGRRCLARQIEVPPIKEIL